MEPTSRGVRVISEGGFRYLPLRAHAHRQEDRIAARLLVSELGAWADPMQLPPEILTAAEAGADARARLDPLVRDMAGGQLDRWVIFRPTYIRLELDAGDRVTRAESSG